MSQKQKILITLSDGRWHSMVELNGICFRYGGRIFELRDAGIDIEMKKEKRVSYYRLVTPKTNIDFDNVRLKPVPVETQMRLL